MKTLLHTTRIPVRWSDQVAEGHVNNARIFQYADEARVEVLRRTFPDGLPDGGGPLLVAATVEFKRPIAYPATVVVRTYGGPPGRTSFSHRYELFLDGDDDTVYATCDARLVWVDRTGRPTPLPDALRASLPPADA